MADALTAFLVDQLGSVIKQEIEHEVRLVVGVRKEVEKLKKTFKVIQTVLNDAEQRQMNEESVKLWLEEFKNVAYDIEDVLDEWRMEILSSQIEGLDDDDDDDGSKQIMKKKTLNLEWCRGLRKLPKGMSRMINLRHLNISGTDNLEYLPEGIGRLKSLQTLTKFVVGGGASGGEYQIRELQNLNFLQGFIEITGLGRLKTEDEASKAELQKKQRLSHLLLDFNSRIAWGPPTSSELEEIDHRKLLGFEIPKLDDKQYSVIPSTLSGEVTHISREFYGIGSGRVNNLTAFLKLTELYIYNMPKLEELDLGVVAEEEEEGNKVNKVKAAAGSRDNTIIIMPCLTLLEIRRCSKLKRLRVLTKLPSLQTLSLRDCSSLSQLPISPNLTTLEIQNSIVLPQGIAQLKELQCLDLSGIDNLTCIPEYVQNLTKLQQLTIEGCPDQLTQRCRKDEGEDWNIISHIPNININGEKIQIQQR
ncbi:Leucine-rich repeat [Macleaya cordata]|uniref:Leucine-rich repeat n=1 Tax=Macleaya cordata TaxID=56857 RepID=A0A200QVI5_MACCD|nr:Leucine-rich repeat [Macleaya cordata]